MKLNQFNKYFLIALIFIIAASCYSVVVFAKINEDVVDMEDLTKVTTTQNNTYEDKTVVAGSRGDINGDGRINIQDLVMLKKRLAEYKNILVVEKACDISGDGIIDIRDAVLLSKYLAGFNINLDDIATPVEPTTPPMIATPIEPIPTKPMPTEPIGVPTITEPQPSTTPQVPTTTDSIGVPTITAPQPSTVPQVPTTEPIGIPTIPDEETTHPDPDGPGWSDWIKP